MYIVPYVTRLCARARAAHIVSELPKAHVASKQRIITISAAYAIPWLSYFSRFLRQLCTPICKIPPEYSSAISPTEFPHDAQASPLNSLTPSAPSIPCTLSPPKYDPNPNNLTTTVYLEDTGMNHHQGVITTSNRNDTQINTIPK